MSADDRDRGTATDYIEPGPPAADSAGRGLESVHVTDRSLVTDESPSIRELESKRKRLRYRSCNRGMKETDLLLGRFADRHLASFDARQLARYEALLRESDPDILAWIAGRETPPVEHDNDVTKLLLDFKYYE